MYKFIALALVAAPALLANGNTATATAKVGVKIVAPIAIVNPDNSQLNFGTVTVNDPTKGITVKNLPDGTVAYDNCDPYTGTSMGSQAWFHVRKDHDLTWGNVDVIVDTTVDLGSGVSVAITPGAWSGCYTYMGQPAVLSNTVVGEDMKHFYVGGTLTAPANTFGKFDGRMNVVANYK